MNADVGHLYCAGGVFAGLFGAQSGVLFPVDHIVASNLVFPGAHQRQFHLVLDVFNVDGATRRHAALEDGADLIGELGHGFMDTR